MSDDPPSTPPPTIVLEPSLVADEFIGPAELGPTAAQLAAKRDQGTLQLGDIAGYLAVRLALSEGRSEVPIAREVVEMLGEHFGGKAAWAKACNDVHTRAVQLRNAELQRLAKQYPDLKPTEIADRFLAEAAKQSEIADKLTTPDPDMVKLLSVGAEDKEGNRRLMARETLAEIIRGEEQK
jgi:hypothetical protein